MTLTIDEFFKIASPKQMKILEELHQLAEKESELAYKINNVYESINKGSYINNGQITICESEDDANVITAKNKEELIIVKEKIAETLKKAVENGMGNVGIIQRQYKNYIGKDIE